MATVAEAGTAAPIDTAKRDRLVIVASSLGTVFEWYDFFVYGTLAALLGQLFFPSDNETAAFLKSLATFGAGFGVRPLGALLFGQLGDRIGRKYTFLMTITLMGVATAGVGLLPTYAAAGFAAPALLVTLRLLQGLALGGEYGGAAIYVAEHAPKGRRGYYTSWIQVSVVGGFLLSLGVVLATQSAMSEEAWRAWGWRIPFLNSLLLLAISLYIRLKLKESPVFQALKEAGETSKSPLKESFATWDNTRRVLVALFGIAAGLTVIWYTAQFYSLYFLQGAMRVDETTAKTLIGTASIISAPAFVFFGWLSDKVGRRPPMIIGYALTLALLFPLYGLMADASNPALSAAQERAPVVIAGQDCAYNVFAEGEQATPCGRVLDFFSGRGVSYATVERPGPVEVRVGATRIAGESPAAFEAALTAAGYPQAADVERIDRTMVVLAVIVLGILSGMTYGPVAAILVELFPARIRYTSMSIPYHIGTGYFGGFLPFVTQYIVAKSGDAFAGLWYTFAVVALALFTTLFFLPETRHRDIG